jgi:hypothetical protein
MAAVTSGLLCYASTLAHTRNYRALCFHFQNILCLPSCLFVWLQLCGRLRSGQLLAVELLMTPDDPADFLSEAQLQEVSVNTCFFV